MKKLPLVIVIMFVVFAGCSTGRNNEEPLHNIDSSAKIEADEIEHTPPLEYIYTPAPEPILPLEEPPVVYEPTESSIPLERAQHYINEINAIFDRDNGTLWGINLSGRPIMFADPLTRHAVANLPDAQSNMVRLGNLYFGIIPEEVFIGNALVEVWGTEWGMMLWSTVERLEEEQVLSILIHEVFHTWQSTLFGSSVLQGDFSVDDASDALTYIWLEANILLYALAAKDQEIRRQAIHDAFSVRNERRRRVQHGRHDIIAELVEGTAVYTELMLIFHDSDARLASLRERASQINSRFGATYFFGAIFGILLDELGAEWRDGLRHPSADLGRLLQDAAGITTVTPFAELCFEQYGYSEIVARIAFLEETYARITASAIDAFAYTRTLHVPDMGAMPFFSDLKGHSLLVPGLGTIFYGNIQLINTAGQLTVNYGLLRWDGNHLFQINYVIPIIDIEFDGKRAFGHNWELLLNDDFIISEMPNGNFVVERIS